METPIRIGILLHPITHIIIVTTDPHILLSTLGKVIVIYEIISRIVGWIDIDHLHLAKISLLEQLQHIEIVPLDVEVFAVERTRRAVSPDTVRHDGAQRHRNRRVRREDRLPLVGPCERIALLAPLHDLAGQLLPQHIEVDRLHDLPVPHDLRQRIREEPPHLLHIRRHVIPAVHLHPLHRTLSYSAHIKNHFVCYSLVQRKQKRSYICRDEFFVINDPL